MVIGFAGMGFIGSIWGKVIVGYSIWTIKEVDP